MTVLPDEMCIIPLDGRPVCYQLPQQLACMAGMAVHLPPSSLLAAADGLKSAADETGLLAWIHSKNDSKGDASLPKYHWLLAMDTLAYGGLIPSRLGEESLQELIDRVECFFQRLSREKPPHETQLGQKHYGYASILRIPHYNSSEEEPVYWEEWGEALYQYSVCLHASGDAQAKVYLQEKAIPDAVVQDFHTRRQRNFRFNQWLLAQVVAKRLDYFILCQDDTGSHGLNVQEAQQLQQKIEAMGLTQQAHLQTGADEIACCMLSRWWCGLYNQQPKIYPIMSSPGGASVLARYDGTPIVEVVSKQIRSCGGVLAERLDEADLVLLVHTPRRQQGDHCMGLASDVTDAERDAAIRLVQTAQQTGQKLILADLAYANGADPILLDRLLEGSVSLLSLYGYAAWNTSGNRLGTAISSGILRWLAEQLGTFNPEAFKQLLLTRFADDGLYQSQVRGILRVEKYLPESAEPNLNTLMAPGIERLKALLKLKDRSVHCKLPCQRFFEVEVTIT